MCKMQSGKVLSFLQINQLGWFWVVAELQNLIVVEESREFIWVLEEEGFGFGGRKGKMGGVTTVKIWSFKILEDICMAWWPLVEE